MPPEYYFIIPKVKNPASGQMQGWVVWQEHALIIGHRAAHPFILRREEMNDIEYIEALQNLITQRNELRSALAEKEKECANLKKMPLKHGMI
jgi:hypothetical protein